MKRFLSLSITVLLLLTAAAFAQQSGRGPMPGFGGPNGSAREDGDRPGDRGPEALIRFLDLTDSQKTQWQALHEQFRATIEPVIEELRALREQLRTMLESGSPDPTSVGALVIQEHAFREQLRSEHEQLQSDLKAILTSEQLVKYEAFLAARRHHEGPGPGGGYPPCGARP